MNNEFNNQPMNNIPNQPQKSNSNIITIILLVILIIMVGFFGYKQFIAKDNNTTSGNENNGGNNTVEPTTTPTTSPSQSPVPSQNVITQLNVNSEEVQKVLKESVYNYSYIWNEYKDENILISKLDYKTKMSIILAMVAKNYQPSSENDYSKTYTMNKTDFEKLFYKIFGEDVKYDFTSISNLASDVEKPTIAPLIKEFDEVEVTKVDLSNSIRIEGDKVYLSILYGGPSGHWGGVTLYTVANTLVNAEKDNTKMYVYEKVAFYEQLQKCADGTSNCVNSTKVYKDANKNQTIAEANEWINNKNEHIETIKDKLDTFKYTFVSNGDGTYHLYSVEKVK